MSQEYLRRYADIPALIYLLREQKITLLDPQSRDDTNDSYYLALYRKKKGLKSVLVLCFTQAGETYHLWRVFAGGPSGVSIRFRRSELLQATRKQAGLRARSVEYLRLAQGQNSTLAIRDLPFLKRYAFEDEAEFRMVYESMTTNLPKLDIPIPLSSVDRITLSPWIHPDLFLHVKKILCSVDGCSRLKIVRSTLIGNEEWKRLGETAAD